MNNIKIFNKRISYRKRTRGVGGVARPPMYKNENVNPNTRRSLIKNIRVHQTRLPVTVTKYIYIFKREKQRVGKQLLVNWCKITQTKT